MKIPRNISGNDLISALQKMDFKITRQKGSHIRLTKIISSEEYHITIPNHNPIKIGTLNAILNELSVKLKIEKKLIVDHLK